MTIRKKWILSLGLIAVIAIVVNSFVLSMLISSYFYDYLDEDYNQTCEQIVSFLSDELDSGEYSEDLISVELETYLGDCITEIKVYDTSGTLIVDVSEDSYSMMESGHSGIMGRMYSYMSDRYNVVDAFDIENNGEEIGEIHVIRYSTSSESYSAILFKNSLFQNSIISLGIVMIIVFILGIIMSKRFSRELIYTADLAKDIDIGNEKEILFSKTKEVYSIQRSLEILDSKLKLKRKSQKSLVDEMLHQTRTPLTILKMHIEGIQDGVLEMDSEEMKICQNQINNLEEIIKNIGGMIDAGTIEKPFVVEEFELDSFIRQIYNGMRSQFQKKKINYSLKGTEKIQIRTDKFRLGQSIYNILTNAYKFTPENGKVSIYFYVKNENIIIEIEDSGCGISKEDQSRIFDAYYKKDSGSGNAGDGIGLYIVKENIESIQGSVKLESMVAKGTKFILTVPANFQES